MIEAVHPSLRVRLSSFDRAHAAEEREREERVKGRQMRSRPDFPPASLSKRKATH